MTTRPHTYVALCARSSKFSSLTSEFPALSEFLTTFFLDLVVRVLACVLVFVLFCYVCVNNTCVFACYNSVPDTGNPFLLGTPFSCVASIGKFLKISRFSVKPSENRENLKNPAFKSIQTKSFRMQHPAPSVTLATGGYDRQIRFWSPQDGSCRHHIMFPDSVRLSLSVIFSLFRSDATIVLRNSNTNSKSIDSR